MVQLLSTPPLRAQPTKPFFLTDQRARPSTAPLPDLSQRIGLRKEAVDRGAATLTPTCVCTVSTTASPPPGLRAAMASQVQQNPQFRQQSLSPAHDQAALEASRSNGTASSNPGAPQKEGPRRTSFNFLRRQKSSEAKQSSNAPKSGPNNMSGKMSKKQRAVAQEELARQQREAAALGRSPPRLPTHSPLPTINAFGGAQGGDTRPDSVAIATNRYPQGQLGSPAAQGRQQGAGGAGYHAVSSHVPIPPIPQGPASSPVSRNGEYDPYSRSESMTHRGRYSYASSAVSMGTLNSPRRVRRRRDPTPFKYVNSSSSNLGRFGAMAISWAFC